MTYEEEKQLRIDDPTRTYTIETVWNDGLRRISWPYSREEAEEEYDPLTRRIGTYNGDMHATLTHVAMLKDGVIVDEWEM